LKNWLRCSKDKDTRATFIDSLTQALLPPKDTTEVVRGLFSNVCTPDSFPQPGKES